MNRCIVNLKNLGVGHGGEFPPPLMESIDKAMQKWAARGGADAFLLPCNYYPNDLRLMHIDPFVRAAMAKGEDVFFLDINSMHSIFTSVIDWVAGMREADPHVYGKIPKMKFEAMIAHSEKWHAAIAKKAEKRRALGLVLEDPGAPVCMRLTGEFEGWSWVWLKSNDARDAESDAMGHCVGRGGYDGLPPGQGVFSLRDKNNFPHVTMLLRGSANLFAMAKGNTKPAERYKAPISAAISVIGRRLEVIKDPVPELDGKFEIEGIEYWFRNGLLHRDDGPAIVGEHVKTERTDRNLFGRLIDATTFGTSHVVHAEFWFQRGVLHREDGPAISNTFDGRTEYYRHGAQVMPDGGFKSRLSKDVVAGLTRRVQYKVDVFGWETVSGIPVGK